MKTKKSCEIMFTNLSVAGKELTIFDNQIIGVNLINSNFTSVNSVFQNTGSRGTGIYAYADNASNNRLQVIPVAMTLGNNKFVDCGKAIRADNYFENNIQYCDVRSTQSDWNPTTTKYGFDFRTNRYKNYRILYNSIYNVTSAIFLNAYNDNYNISGIPSYGQYAGNINVDFNNIRPNLATSTVNGQSILNAIFLENAGGVTEYANGVSAVISTNGNIIQASRGIYYNNWKFQNVQSQNNNVTVRYNQYLNASSQIYFGISVNNSLQGTPNGNFIRSNSVTGFYTPTANSLVQNNPNLIGIVSSLSGSIAVTCNSTSATARGFVFRGIASNCLFRNNFMQGNRYGFVLDNASVIGQQGILTSPADNQWSGSWLAGNFKTAILNGSSAQFSKMCVRPSSAYNPDGSGEALTLLPLVDKYSLSNGNLLPASITSPFPSLACFQIVLPTMFQKSLENIAEDSNVFSNVSNVSSDIIKFINKQLLYNTLKKDTILRDSSTILTMFFNENLFTSFETIYKINKYIEKGYLAEALASNSNFTASNNIEQNFKKFNEIYHKYLVFDNYSLADSIDLREIAQKCPFSDGEVVYKSRALYNLIFEKSEIFEDLCDANTNQKSIKISSEADKKEKFILYPNPAIDKIFIEIDDIAVEKITIAVFDATGKKVINSYDLAIADGLFSFDLHLNNGVYLIHIIDGKDNKPTITKLVISK